MQLCMVVAVGEIASCCAVSLEVHEVKYLGT